MKAIVNATPLIALSITGHLDLLQILFSQIIVPRSVYDEVVVSGRDRPGSRVLQSADWLRVEVPSQTSPIPVALMGLDLGEQDVILLGQELDADWLIIDERLGRKIAQAMGFRVKGTLGLFLVAYQLQVLTQAEVDKAVNRLADSSIRLSPRLINWLKSQLREQQ
jgi:predicted nucleic acid-binding protein